jgi:hypothetical protein
MLMNRKVSSVFRLGLFAALLPVILTSQEVDVSTEPALREAIRQANTSGGPLTIRVAPGDYQLTDALWIHASGVTVIGTGSTRSDVILRGRGMHNSQVPHGIWIAGNHCRIENLTIRDVYYHGIQLNPGADHLVVRQVHFLDTREQMLKGAFNSATPAVTCDYGLVEDCLFEYSAGIGPQFYIGGIDVHRGTDWVVRNNTFRAIRSPSVTVAEHAIHFWNFSSGTLVEGNTITNCDRGIGFGLGSSGHSGGIIRNNMIYHDTSEGFADVGIGLESSPGAVVVHNTVFFSNSYPNAIEYRFASTTDVVIRNNLTNKLIRQRDSASATLGTNVTNATSDWFLNPATGDLRLATAVASVVDQGADLGVERDHEGGLRPVGNGPDIGADEWLSAPFVNHAPVLEPVGNRTVPAGQNLSLQIMASDEDSDSLEFSASASSPP